MTRSRRRSHSVMRCLRSAVSSATSTPMPATSILASTLTSGTSISSLSVRNACASSADCIGSIKRSTAKRVPADLLCAIDRIVAEGQLARRGCGVGARQLAMCVPDQYLAEGIASVGRIEQVRRDLRVERELVHVDAFVEHRHHDRFGVVRRDRAAAIAEQVDQHLSHRRLEQQITRDPRDIGQRRVDHDGQTAEGTGVVGCDGERTVDLAQSCQQGTSVGGGLDQPQFGFEHIDRTEFGRDRVGTEGLDQSIVQRTELEEVEEPAHFFGVGLAHAEVGRFEFQLHVADEHHHVGVAAHATFELGQARLEFGRLLVDMGKDAIDAAVFHDELRRGLLADAGHAQQVVRGVTAQRGVLHVQRRRNTSLLFDALLVVQRVVGDAAAVVEHLDEWVFDELIAVAIAGDDDRLHAGVACPGRQRGDDVVGLEADLFDDRDTQRLGHFAHQTHLLAQDVGCRFTRRLVLLDLGVAKRRLGAIERHRDMIGFVVAQQVDEHRCEPVHRVGDLAVRGRHIGRQREECAVGQRIAVDQHQLGHDGSQPTAGGPRALGRRRRPGCPGRRPSSSGGSASPPAARR